MKNLIEDINFAIVKDSALEDEDNLELFKEAVDTWQGLLNQIEREKKTDKAMYKKWELNPQMIAEFSMNI